MPTVREQGVDFVIITGQGLFLAQNTPEPIVRELNAALNKAMGAGVGKDEFGAVGRRSRHAERPERSARPGGIFHYHAAA